MIPFASASSYVTVVLLSVQAFLLYTLYMAIASAKGITRGTEVMSRTIVETCREIQHEVKAVHDDLLAFGARLTDVEGQIESVVRSVGDHSVRIAALEEIVRLRVT